MDYKSFKHNDPDVFHDKELTMHDCIAEKITFENGILRFYLTDGIWITPHHKENPFDKTVRTGPSMVEFVVKDIDDVTLRVFIRRSFCWFRTTTTELWHIEQLISAVNSGKCTVEFITQYRSHFEQMWHCVINSEKKPHYRECQLFLPETEATFHWNDLRPDREW